MKKNPRIAFILIAMVCAWLSTLSASAAPPVVAFLSPTNNQIVTSLNSVAGTATTDTGSITSVTVRIREVDIHGGTGRWWNGTDFQGTAFHLPTTLADTNWTLAASVVLPPLNSGISYELMATAIATSATSNSVQITVTTPLTTLTWDTGTAPEGTQVLANPNPNGGNYRFKITTQNPAVGVWRTALKVTSGEAHLYLSTSSSLTTNSYAFKSDRGGSDGVVLHSSQFPVGQERYFLVNATPGAEWSLLTGDAFVYDLGSLATNSASSTNVNIGPESMVFFKTTVPAETLAWRLWASGATNTVYVKKSLAAHPNSYDLIQSRAMLVVPPYLNTGTFNGSYFVAIPGAPGTLINLDSRQQNVTDWSFNAGLPAPIDVTTNDYPYLTYRVHVPVEQIAWENALTPSVGNPNLAVRRDAVPNEYRNDAYSDVSGSVGDTVTLVPADSGTAGLTDGTYYVTVYGSNSFTTTLTNRNPVITDVPYAFHVTNDIPNRTGWRYYRITDITNQLGSLGWELLLSNALPSAEIAIRRNAVPGRWNFRNNDNSLSSSSLGFVDYSGSSGFLQRPDHQADIWYIGVYQPSQPLGAFELTGNELEATLLALDGPGGVANISNQLPGRWEYFQVDIPTNTSALGWDVRVQDVSGGGTPKMVVRRDALPGNLDQTLSSPGSSTDWPSGSQWAAGADWTGYSQTSSGQGANWQVLTMGLGNPLQPGTYYVGVYNNATGTNTTSYTLVSRAIGTNGQSIVVRDLGFVGSTNGTGLLPREADYYRVVVPSNSPSWQVKLAPTVGEAMLVAHRRWIPNSDASSGNLYNFAYVSGQYQPTQPSGGREQQKTGNEHLAVLPASGSSYYDTNLPPGEYFLAVVSEGVNPSGSRIGSNTVSYTLSSGPVLTNYPVASGVTNQLQQVGPVDLVFTNAQEFGEYKLYQFEVPPGVLSMEVRLENRVGNPWMNLKQTSRPVEGHWWWTSSCPPYYASVNGEDSTWDGSGVITVAAPVPGTYTLAVAATTIIVGSCQPANASYVVRVRDVSPVWVDFDGGTTNVIDQPAMEWRYFKIVIPTNTLALGWDVRVQDVSGGGTPKMVVRRDALPGNLDQTLSSPGSSTDWPSGSQWAAGADWTGYSQTSSGQGANWQVLTMGLGNPLQPGTYYVGVYNNATGTNTTSYTLVSRAIGTNGQSIVVRDLGFVGSTNGTGLLPREADYYRVVVPSNSPSWQVKLAPTVGEAMLVAHRRWIPNSDASSGNLYNFAYVSGQYQPTQPSGGREQQKTGNEHLAVLPASGSSYYDTNLPPGEYFLAVVSEGVNPSGSRIGSNTVSYTLSSGPVLTNYPVASGVTNQLQQVGPVDLVFTNAQEFGEYKLYQFEVPPGVLSMEVRLENRVGNPWMNLKQTSRPVEGHWWWTSSCPPYYASVNGEDSTWDGSGVITVAAPVPGTYTLAVAATTIIVGSCQPANASYVVRVRDVSPVWVDFDGGTTNVIDQPAMEWRYFKIVIPTNTLALGWDVRVQDVSGGGTPKMVVRRDALPGNLDQTLSSPGSSTDWPSGSQWAAGADWTGYSQTSSGQGANWQVLTMGLGNPLQPGTYYVGVYNNATGTNTTSYTLVSRAIGTNGQSIVVRDLGFVGSTNGTGLLPREADYYRVVVPSNSPSWQVKLAPTVGEAMLVAHRRWIPNSDASSGNLYNFAYVSGQYQPTQPTGGLKQNKTSNEHLVVLPNYSYETNLPPGEYYVAVVSEGVNPSGSRIGSNTVSYTLSSGPVLTNYPCASGVTNQLQQVGSVDLVFTNAQEFGEYELYQFTVPPGVLSMEVRLENRVGNPWMSLKQTSRPVEGTWWFTSSCGTYYASVNGEDSTWDGSGVITVAAPVPGTYTLAVTALRMLSGCQPTDASYVVRVRKMEILNLNISSELNTNGFTNVLGGLLADNQRAFFRVEVPATVSNAPVLGWKLDLAETSGTPSLRVRKDALPSDSISAATTPFSTGSAMIAPPFLTPGTWYVEIKGSGSTAFTLTSSAVTTNNLTRPLWAMPALDQTNVAAGLSLPWFGDTGVAASGMPLPDDQGTDLEQGLFHYYAIQVPADNGGLLRTELQAISGNPNLYVRAGAVPTLSHGATGSSGSLHDRSLTGSANSEYGNWVPLNGRTEHELTNGVWIIAVQAAGNSNCRYRLKLSCGNAVTNGLVQDLSLDGTTLSSQSIAGRDWRYYRFTVPANPPTNYVLTFNRTLGGARVYVRDTIPPGDLATPQNYDSSYDPVDWDYSQDSKNQGPYPRFADPGTFTLNPPPLRPGSTYFFGVWSYTDSTFSLSLTTNGALLDVTNSIAFYGGGVTNISLPANATHLYRVDVPADATRWRHYTTNSSAVVTTIEQGTLPRATGTAHWRSSGVNPTLNMALTPTSWPWQPAQTYYLLLTNTAASTQLYTLRLDGRNAATEDEDNDGIPDQWELSYFPSIYSYNASADPDGDGVSNYHEWLNGSSPKVAESFSLAQPERLGNGHFQFLFVGPNNGRYRAQYRTNFNAGNWTTLVNFTNVGGSTLIVDPNALNSSQRFYRAAPMP